MRKNRIDALQKELIRNLKHRTRNARALYGSPYTRNGETVTTDLCRIFIVQTPETPDSPEKNNFPNYRAIFTRKSSMSGIVFNPRAAYEKMKSALAREYEKSEIVQCRIRVNPGALGEMDELVIKFVPGNGWVRRVVRIPCRVVGERLPHSDIQAKFLLSCLGAFREESELQWEQEDGLTPHLFQAGDAELFIMPPRP